MKKIYIFLIKIYQNTLSKALRFYFGPGCRFTPTCSEYSIDVVKKYGLIKGGRLTFQRILHCHP
jgi:putative membrane protein insertion efficiency factor